MLGIPNFVVGNDVKAEHVTHAIGKNAVAIRRAGGRAPITKCGKS